MVTLDRLTAKNRERLASLEAKMGSGFVDLRYLQHALIHKSYAFEQKKGITKDNERLEFLGDAVLDLAVGVALFKYFPEMAEGELTKLRSALVNESHLRVMADEIDLGQYLLLGRGEEMTDGRQKASILADAYEAVIGAIFLDSGYEVATCFIEKHFTPWFKQHSSKLLVADAKSTLQEVYQEKYNEAPVYLLDKEEGPDHDKRFFVTVCFRGKTLGAGKDSSKKEAEQKAAAAAIRNMDDL